MQIRGGVESGPQAAHGLRRTALIRLHRPPERERERKRANEPNHDLGNVRKCIRFGLSQAHIQYDRNDVSNNTVEAGRLCIYMRERERNGQLMIGE